MKKNKIKRIFKKKAVLFICSFLFCLAFIVLSNKFFDFKGMGPSSWEDTIRYSPLSIILSLGFAVWVTWVAFSK